MIDKTLAHYKIIELIGKGGMGEVYRARDQRLDRDVALKFLIPSDSHDADRVRRFAREAKVLASLDHPNIATIHDFHDDGGAQFFAMEFISGSTVETEITDNGLALDRLLEIGIPLAGAIAFAHERGVIHRDLKPANVMRDASKRIKVLDFGLAALRQAPSPNDPGATMDALTAVGAIMGTTNYMAPEQVEGRAVDERTDVFALGVILHELATGKRPFLADSTAGIAAAILSHDPAPLQDIRSDLPADLARVIRRCLAKKPDQRMQTAQDVLNELEDIHAGIRTDAQASSPARSEIQGSLAEGRMKITTEHVRQLSKQIPRMVGDTMTYLDNQRQSDVLIVCLHGIGADQSDYEEVLRQTPHRAVSLSLYGFGPEARMRPPLPYVDHNRLAGFLIEDIRRKFAPRSLVLVGHSSGADQCLHITTSPQGERLQPDGLILLGPAVVLGEGQISGPYSRMTVDPDGVFNTVRTVSSYANNLTEWLILHEYLIQAFGKFQSDIGALQIFAKTYIESLDGDNFFQAFRTAADRTQHLRCLFGSDDTADLDRALKHHINNNALGNDFSEEMIVNVDVGHNDLKNAAVVLPLVDDIVGHLA